MDPNLEILIAYANSFLGVPYLYGGHNRLVGIDCSSYACELLKSVGLIGYHDQFTALGLYQRIKSIGTKVDINALVPGAFIFFGPDSTAINHVAFVISKYVMIEAGGGDSNTTTIEIAKEKGACVRQRSTALRTDRYEAWMPRWPWA